MKLLAYEVDKRSFLGVLNEDETWVYPVLLQEWNIGP